MFLGCVVDRIRQMDGWWVVGCVCWSLSQNQSSTPSDPDCSPLPAALPATAKNLPSATDLAYLHPPHSPVSSLCVRIQSQHTVVCSEQKCLLRAIQLIVVDLDFISEAHRNFYFFILIICDSYIIHFTFIKNIICLKYSKTVILRNTITM